MKALARVVHPVKEVGEDSRDEKVADAERHCGGKDETVAAREADIREYAYARRRDAREQECRYTAQDGVRNCESNGR